jgi:hypothetical protein
MEERGKYIQDRERKSILDDEVGNQIGINLVHRHQRQYMKEGREEGRE